MVVSITSDDYKNIAFSTLVSGTPALVGYAALSKNKNDWEKHIAWWKNSRKPSWAPENLQFYALMDTLTFLPMGYASYIIYKSGIEHQDTKLALATYASVHLITVAGLPFIIERNWKKISMGTVAVNTLLWASAYLFYKIDKTAGQLLVPAAVWGTFYSVLTHQIAALEDAKKPKLP